MTHRDCYIVNSPPCDSPGVKFKPFSTSKDNQTATTPREALIIESSHTEQNTPLSSYRDTRKRRIDKKENTKVDNKGRKDSKALNTKPIKIDVVYLNSGSMRTKQKRLEKVDQGISQMDAIYNKLRKTITDNKSKAVNQDAFIQTIENFKAYMTNTQSILQGFKTK